MHIQHNQPTQKQYSQHRTPWCTGAVPNTAARRGCPCHACDAVRRATLLAHPSPAASLTPAAAGKPTEHNTHCLCAAGSSDNGRATHTVYDGRALSHTQSVDAQVDAVVQAVHEQVPGLWPGSWGKRTPVPWQLTTRNDCSCCMCSAVANAQVCIVGVNVITHPAGCTHVLPVACSSTHVCQTQAASRRVRVLHC